MRIVSINTALPTAIEHQGKIVSTGIFKQAINKQVWVGKDNIQGDGQADLKNHGGEHKAVYAFADDHYPYWRKILKKPDLSHGAFGENLTIAGFDESQIHIGDQIQIGQCILEVTQPRVPCFKLAIAVGNQNMPRLFIEHFATGIYLRVLEEGYIAPENAVDIITENSFKLSVQSLFRAYFDKNFENSVAVMKQALHIPALSDEWRKKLTVRLSAD